MYAKFFSPNYIEKVNLEVGDIVLQNGKYLSYADFITHAEGYIAISYPAGVICYKGDTGTNGITGKVYMIGLVQGSSLWAPFGTTGFNTKFSTSDTAGEGNWAVITEADPTGSADAATYYPAFNYANTYSVTGYTSGWFLPSINELKKLYTDRIKINDSINAIIWAGGTATALPTDIGSLWSSSQYSTNTVSAWYVTFSSGAMYGSGKNDSTNVRVVRALD